LDVLKAVFIPLCFFGIFKICMKRQQKTKTDNSLFAYYGFTEKDTRKYPVISRILKQLTPERIKKEIEQIQKIKLPAELQKWVKEYEKVGERDDFIWKWLYKMNEVSLFFKISKRYRFSLVKVKTLFNMFIILLDDISERNQEILLENLLRVPFQRNYIKFKNLSIEEKQYLKFTLAVWKGIETIIKNFPNYTKYKEIFCYDVSQFLNEVKYAYLIYKHSFLMNELEYWTYFPQGMQIIIDFDLDLMCLSKSKFENLGVLREIILILQKMARIGNWLSTWEREAKYGDFTAGVFPYAVKQHIIGPLDLLKTNKLESKKEEMINKIKASDAEKYLLRKWEKYYRLVDRTGRNLKFINSNEILKKFEYLLYMHLLSRGYK